MKKIFLLITIIATNLYAQNKTDQSQIKVFGEGKIKVAPDIIVVSIGVETKGNDLVKVKEDNDKLIEKVNKYLIENKINPKDIKAKWFSLYPWNDYNNDKDVEISYRASQNMEVTIRDISQYQKITNELVKIGITRIDNAFFSSSKVEKLKSEARELAIKNAQQKANDFARALKLKLGKVIFVSDDSRDFYDDYYGHGRDVTSSSVMVKEDTAFGEDFNVGEIEVKITTTVTFLLD